MAQSRVEEVIFRCDANQSQGFGHLSRCINLGRRLRQDFGLKIKFMGDYGDFAKTLLKTLNFDRAACLEDCPTAKTLIDALPKHALVVVDHYGVTQSFIDELGDASSDIVYFVDEDQLDYKNKAKALISVRLQDQEMKLERFGVPVFSGPKFFITKPEFEELRAINCASLVSSKVQKIVLFLSGIKGHHGAEAQIARALNEVAAGSHLTLISNSASEHQGLQANTSAITLNITAPNPYLERVFSQADLIICGGGLLKYESAFCAIPSAICSLVELQHHDTQAFCRRGLGWDLGSSYSQEFAAKLGDRLRRIVEDRNLRQNIRDQSKMQFFSDSSERLAAALMSSRRAS